MSCKLRSSQLPLVKLLISESGILFGGLLRRNVKLIWSRGRKFANLRRWTWSSARQRFKYILSRQADIHLHATAGAPLGPHFTF
ncbi:hypothetical protein LINPERHAP1_LOCUS38934 [Linum perenne]